MPLCSQVLCTTSTLAQGMNLPARLVSGAPALPALSRQGSSLLAPWQSPYASPCLALPLYPLPLSPVPCPPALPCPPAPVPAGGHQGHAALRGQRGRRRLGLPRVRAQHLPAGKIASKLRRRQLQLQLVVLGIIQQQLLQSKARW